MVKYTTLPGGKRGEVYTTSLVYSDQQSRGGEADHGRTMTDLRPTARCDAPRIEGLRKALDRENPGEQRARGLVGGSASGFGADGIRLDVDVHAPAMTERMTRLIAIMLVLGVAMPTAGWLIGVSRNRLRNIRRCADANHAAAARQHAKNQLREQCQKDKDDGRVLHGLKDGLKENQRSARSPSPRVSTIIPSSRLSVESVGGLKGSRASCLVMGVLLARTRSVLSGRSYRKDGLANRPSTLQGQRCGKIAEKGGWRLCKGGPSKPTQGPPRHRARPDSSFGLKPGQKYGRQESNLKPPDP